MGKLIAIFLFCTGIIISGFNRSVPRIGIAGLAGESKCRDCHDIIDNQKVVHPPAEEDCTTCHEPLGNNHPDDNTFFKLTDKVPDLCYTCHDQMNTGAHIHKPVEEGKCVSCHSPHASNNKSLLIKEPMSLCLSCHNKTYNSESGTTKNIKKILDNSATIHGAIEGDGCLPCHNPHSSKNALLLTESYPDRHYTTGEEDKFALCFSCHLATLMTQSTTTSATSFRAGNKNLHFVHVNKSKSRSCSNCHSVHASPNAHMIETNVRFNTWDMPLNYIVSEKGGSCRPGCHGIKNYER